MNKPVLAAFLSVKGLYLSDQEKCLFAKYNPAGIILFNRNLTDKDQAAQLAQQIKETVGHDDIFIAVDQEGGRVNRLKAAGFGEYSWQKTLGQINSAETVALHARLIAEDLHMMGANLNFAPVLDIEYPQTTSALRGRCFGSSSRSAAHLGKAMIEAYIASGICPCMKHMPGHGLAATDPHLGLPIITTPFAELQNDFYPFAQNNQCPAGMTAHILIPEIDPHNPLTLSKKGIEDIIRQRIGFNGLLISDAIDMKALSGTASEKACRAWEAGCDIISYCFGKYEEMEEICRNAVYLNDKGLERLNKAKNILQNYKKSIKLDNERKKYYSLINKYDEKINYDATEVLHQMQKGEK